MPHSQKKEIVRQLKDALFLFEAILEKEVDPIHRIGKVLLECVRRGNRILLCGNGGSAADAQHIACELVVRLNDDRRSVPAISLTTNTSILTAVSNDIGFERCFARQIEGHGREGDILLVISTSGNSPNVVEAARTAREKQLTVVGLLGKGGGTLKDLCDHSIVVPSRETQRIQEIHIAIAHIWCNHIEKDLRA